MSGIMLLLAILPIIAFVFVDMYAGYKKGIYSAIILGIMVFFLNWYITKELELSTFLEPILIIIFGVISLKLANTKIFKFQPVFVNLFSAILLAYYQYFSTPFFVKYLPAMSNMLDNSQVTAEVKDFFVSPANMAFLSIFSSHLIIFFILHAILVAYTAAKSSNLIWLLSRLAVYPTLFAMFLIEAAIYLF